MPKQTRSSAVTPRPQGPMPTKVQEDDDQRPVTVTIYGEPVAVELIVEQWEDEEFWWRDNPVVRISYRVTLEGGQELTLFKNMLTGGWYRLTD